MLYIEWLKEEDWIRKAAISARIERSELALIKRNDKTTYIENILKTDQDYKDKVFWLVENSSGETAESIRKFTLGWATEYQKRLEKRLHDKAKRNSRGGKEGE